MKIISWNVNGIRSVYKKSFMEFVEREDPDILCVQETKAHIEQVEVPLRHPGGRISFWSSAIQPGYSGVATFSKARPLAAATQIGAPEYDNEGRVVITEHPHFRLYNIYFPNGGRSPERHNFKQNFLYDLSAHLKPAIDAGKPIIVVGDYNIAHKPIDIHDPVGNAGESGFLPGEREWFDQFLDLGFVDTFRHFHPKARDRYSWWSARERGRVGNRGWRIDYICVTKNLVPRLKSATILDEIEDSDHSPVVLEMKA